jgi:nucleoside phosphorylase
MSQELLHVAIATLPRAIQLRNSYDTVSNIDEISESDLAVLTNTLNQYLSDYDGPDVELAVSPVDNAAASATQSTCLQLPTPDALIRLGDSTGHIQRGIS